MRRTIKLSPRERGLQRQVMAVFQELRQRNMELVAELETTVGRALLRSGFLIEARAKEIITEKGHVVTGNLRRSIATQLVRVDGDHLYAETGTFVEYAPFVEALDDGGFLFPASEEKFPEVIEIMVKEGVVPALENWARG